MPCWDPQVHKLAYQVLEVSTTNFKIDPVIVIQLVHDDQFGSNSNENHHAHTANFSNLIDIIRIDRANGMSKNDIKLKLFPLSLCDKVG